MKPVADLAKNGSLLGCLEQFEPDGPRSAGPGPHAAGSRHEKWRWVIPEWSGTAAEREWAVAELVMP
jgi:hypothetical protein